MNRHYSDTRKIDPSRGSITGDNTPNHADRAEIGPTLLALNEWEAAGLELPDLQAMREYRWRRLTNHVVERDYGAVLMFDPLNIRYATDSTNMQLWNAHNPFRALLLCADGHMIIWDYKIAPFLTEFNPLVKERRSGASFFYFSGGDKCADVAKQFACDVRDVVIEHGGGNMRLAVDKIMLHGAKALESAGFTLEEGEELTEKSRSIKGVDEIKAMRCANHACETACKVMEDFAREYGPTGMVSEDEIWAILHAENIRRGGEWIETRLLATGPRTNPWFQECGPRRMNNNEILAFDTDLVGSYGICIDISRTWWIGDKPPRADMIEAMQHAHEHIMQNMELIKPGARIEDMQENLHRLDDKYQKRKYGCAMHGVGLCDEWPHVDYPDTMTKGAFDYALKPGMVLCVEALVAEDGGDFSIKLEDQVVVTEDGYENLTTYPFDPALMGEV